MVCQIYTTIRTYANSESTSLVPGDIILGPPKTAFASATPARSANKAFDSPARADFGSHAGDANQSNNHSRDTFGREKDKNGGEDHRSKSGAYAKRNGKEEGEHWSGIRSGRNFAREDSERSTKRNGDRENGEDIVDHGDGRQSQQRNMESHRRDTHRDGDELRAPRQNGIGRGHKPSWYQEEEYHEGQGLQGSKDTTKTRDWRDGERGGRRGTDRDWSRNAKVEQDPEWMFEPDGEVKKQKHTADDIEQWKASMRAGKATSDQAASAYALPSKGQDRNGSGAQNHTESRKLDTPLDLDPTFDKFFGLWNESNVGSGTVIGQNGGDASRPDTGKLYAPKSSRFTGFFSPKPEDQPSVAAEPAPPTSSQSFSDPVGSSNADREGFQRILQMLGSGNAPAGPASAGTRPPEQSTRARTPPLERPSNGGRPSPPILSPRSRKSIGLETLLGLQSPNESTLPQNNDSQFLLNLMKPKGFDIREPPQIGPKILSNNPSGILPQPIMTSESTHSNYATEPAPEDAKPRDKLNPTIARRAHRGSETIVPDTFGDIHSQYPQQYQGLQPMFGMPHPLQRPPGFEQVPQTFNPHLQLLPPQRQTIVGPPPGFQASSRNPNQFPPGLIPNLASMNLSVDRGPPFGIRQNGPNPNGPHPGFMAMGNGPPPPGLDERPFSGGHLQRLPMDMFGEFGAAGRGAMPGHFRRQE